MLMDLVVEFFIDKKEPDRVGNWALQQAQSNHIERTQKYVAQNDVSFTKNTLTD